MLLSKSPVRSISEKLKSPQASVKDMKIERKKDFRSFLKYIERESKELEKIKLPARNEVTKKSGSGGIGALLGFGALGLLGLFGGMGDKGNQYKYGDKNLGGNIFRGPYAVGRDRKGGDDDQKIDDPITDLPELPKSTMLSRESRISFQVGAVNSAELKKDISMQKKRQAEAESVVNEKKGKAKAKAKSEAVFKSGSISMGDEEKQFIKNEGRSKKIMRQLEIPTGGGGDSTRNYIRSLKRLLNVEGFDPKRRPINESPDSVYLKENGKITRNFDALTIQEKMRYFALEDSAASPFIKAEAGRPQSTYLNDYDAGADARQILKDKKPIPKKGFFNRMKLDFQKPTLGINTMEGMFSKLGLGKKTNLFKANPKGMNLFKLGTFSKGKTGLFIADVGLAAYDLYSSLRKVTPRSNIGASLLDLVGINLNNFVADMLNNPGMLREYVSVTNDPNAINVNRNREIINENIRKIKEQNKKDFTGGDITKGSITGKQMMENMKKYFTNPQTYNPFSTYQVKPNPDLFTKPPNDPNDDVLSIFQSAAMEAN